MSSSWPSLPNRRCGAVIAVAAEVVWGVCSDCSLLCKACASATEHVSLCALFTGVLASVVSLRLMSPRLWCHVTRVLMSCCRSGVAQSPAVTLVL